MKKITVIVLTIICFYVIWLTCIYRISWSDEVIEIQGTGYFELTSIECLPSMGTFQRSIFERTLGKRIFIVKNDDDKFYYFWLSDSEIKNILGRSVSEMEIECIKPKIRIKIIKLISGYFKIAFVSSIKWEKGMPYLYK